MYCPNCRAEYRPGFTRCSDCNIALVEGLPDEAVKPKETDYVGYQELITTYNPLDVALLKSLLDAEGITYYIQGEHFSYVRPLAIPMRLMVAIDQIEEAAEIIKDLELAGVAYSDRVAQEEGVEDED